MKRFGWLLRMCILFGLLAGCAENAPEPENADELDEIEAPLRVPGDGFGLEEQLCLAGDGSSSRAGRVHNRFLWCQNVRTPLDVIVDGVPVTDGFVNGAAIAYGRDDGKRDVTVLYRALSVEYLGRTGVITPATSLSVWIDCQDKPLPSGPFTPSACSVSGSTKTNSLEWWAVNRVWQKWTVTSDESQSTAADRVLRHQFQLAFETRSANAVPVAPGRGDPHGIRCDSASYFRGRPKACILDDVLPHLQYSVNDPKEMGVANHILTAFNHPENTYPTTGTADPFKRIPGRYTGNPNDPGLHRIVYKGTTWAANQLEKNRACRRQEKYTLTGLPASLYDTSFQDCDEFPFASTREGAANLLWDFSVLGVDRTQNRCAGNALKRFYGGDRILYDTDTFWVEITDAPLIGDSTYCAISPDEEPSDDADEGGVGGGGVVVDQPPMVSAGDDSFGDEGDAITLRGSALDFESQAQVSWTYRALTSVDPGTSCSFNDGDTTSPRFSCNDDGTFEVTLSANDGVNPAVSDSAIVQVRNVAPSLTSISSLSAWQLFRARTAVNFEAPIADPGANDSHTCAVTWDDQTTSTFAANAGRCQITHNFTHAGMYTLSASVTDDDGASSDSRSVMIVVYDPEGPFANADGSIASTAGALVGNNTAGETWFHLDAHYYRATDTKPIGSGKTWLTGTDFRFDGDATGLEWLVVTHDGKIAAKGVGTQQGKSGRYGFVFYGFDGCSGQSTGCQPGADRFRVVVWSLASGPNPGAALIYDNRPQASFDVDLSDPQTLRSGIVLIQPPS